LEQRKLRRIIMKLKKIILIGLIFIIGLLSYLLYFAIDFNNYFLGYSYEERKSKCNYFDQNTLNQKLRKYGFSNQDILALETKESTFDAMFMIQDSSDSFIIMVHGKRECPFAMMKEGFQFYKLGYSVIIPVLYAHGKDSLNGFIDYGRFSVGQVNECVRQAKLLGAKNVGLIGRSMGASIAIIATAKNKEINAIVAECPLKSVESSIEYKHELFSDLPDFPFLNIKNAITEFQIGIDLDSLSSLLYVGKISPRPIFIMAATKDRVVNPNDFEALFINAGEPKQIWREEIDHTKFHSSLKEDFYKKVHDFFDQTFKKD